MLDTDTLELQLSKWKGKEASSRVNFASIRGTAKHASRQSSTLILPLGSTIDARLLSCRSPCRCFLRAGEEVRSPLRAVRCRLACYDCSSELNRDYSMCTVSRTVDVATADSCFMITQGRSKGVRACSSGRDWRGELGEHKVASAQPEGRCAEPKRPLMPLPEVPAVEGSGIGAVSDLFATNVVQATKPPSRMRPPVACFSRLSANFPSCKASDSCQPI